MIAYNNRVKMWCFILITMHILIGYIILLLFTRDQNHKKLL